MNPAMKGSVTEITRANRSGSSAIALSSAPQTLAILGAETNPQRSYRSAHFDAVIGGV